MYDLPLYPEEWFENDENKPEYVVTCNRCGARELSPRPVLRYKCFICKIKEEAKKNELKQLNDY